MIKNSIATFFTVLLMVVNSVPSIIIAIDDSVDISIFYGFSENEEEKKEKESEKTLEVCFIENNNETEAFSTFKTLDYKGYSFKKYSKPHLNLISPPPEQHIL